MLFNMNVGISGNINMVFLLLITPVGDFDNCRSQALLDEQFGLTYRSNVCNSKFYRFIICSNFRIHGIY